MKLRLLENNFSRRVSSKRRTTACFVQWNGGWALEEFKRSGWVNEPWMLNSACSNYRSLPINQLVTTWTAQYMSMSNTAPPPAVSLLSTARWLASPYKYVQTRLKRHRFMRYFVYNVRYSAVRINFSLLTTKLHSSFRTTPVYNDTKYSVPFMTLQQSSTVYLACVRSGGECILLIQRNVCIFRTVCLWFWWHDDDDK